MKIREIQKPRYGPGTLDFWTEMHYICLQHIEIMHLDGFHEGSSDPTFLHLLNAADSGTARRANVVLSEMKIINLGSCLLDI